MKLLACLFVLTACLPGLAMTANLSGKATVDGAGAPGIVVSAYPATALNFETPAAYTSQASDAEGAFAVELPAGEYYLLARGKNLFGYYGRNPVFIPQDGLDQVSIPTVADNRPAPATAAEGLTGVAGVISLNGRAIEGAIVSVYPDLSGQFKGLGLAMAAPTDPRGYFELPLSEGTYYLVVRVRQSGQMVGPLRAGDLFGYWPQNPLVVKGDAPARIHIPLIEVPEKIERHAATMFGKTLVEGRVVDAQGEPVTGVQVLLYDDPTMLNRPLFVSTETDDQGRYSLSFPSGGRYYLAARSELGGTPAPGEYYGRYQGTPDHSIQIKTGQSLPAIEIVVEEVY